jgi:hypothetical protein
LASAGWSRIFLDLRATGRYAVEGDKIGRAPDHNSAEWSLWTGRPLLGQWITDVRRALDAIAQGNQEAFARMTLIGLGPAGLVALGAAIYEPRITRVAMVDSMVSFKSDVPYVNQRMGIIAPRILRDAGNVPHLAALLAPRRLLISGGVAGSGDAASSEALSEQFAYTRQIYRLHGAEAHLTVTAAEKPEDLVKRLTPT